MHINTVALTAGLAATASAFKCSGHYFNFHNRPGDTLSYQRIDPALFPGGESPHLHSFDGGDGLSASTNYQATQNSKCSTARIKADKSLYWRPSLYWHGNGTGYYRVPEKYTKIYYKSYGSTEDTWAEVSAFPENFSMLGGVPLRRSEDNNKGNVQWGCHDAENSEPGATQPPNKIFAKGFPTGFTNCKFGLSGEVTFPSCWNGKPIDKNNPSAHMAYPIAGRSACPDTHNVARFPEILIEFWYDINSFSGSYSSGSNPWVLSNGDPTGCGFHADFLNGWEKGALDKAIGKDSGLKCGCGCDNNDLASFFGADGINDDNDADFKQCHVEAKAKNEATPVLDKLPGCNPIQSGPQDATSVTGPGCVATAAPSSNPAASASSKADAYSTAVAAAAKDYEAKPSSSTPKKPDASSAPVATPKPSAAAPSGECKAPVYVTVTPTLYVTAGTNTTTCDLGTVTKTVTEIATVTMEPTGGFEYGAY